MVFFKKNPYIFVNKKVTVKILSQEYGFFLKNPYIFVNKKVTVKILSREYGFFSFFQKSHKKRGRSLAC